MFRTTPEINGEENLSCGKEVGLETATNRWGLAKFLRVDGQALEIPTPYVPERGNT
jgi:hypothetical protein